MDKLGWAQGIVAPYAGAWIETSKSCLLDVTDCVAPYAGAWIETATDSVTIIVGAGRPLRGGVD